MRGIPGSLQPYRSSAVWAWTCLSPFPSKNVSFETTRPLAFHHFCQQKDRHGFTDFYPNLFAYWDRIQHSSLLWKSHFLGLPYRTNTRRYLNPPTVLSFGWKPYCRQVTTIPAQGTSSQTTARSSIIQSVDSAIGPRHRHTSYVLGACPVGLES